MDHRVQASPRSAPPLWLLNSSGLLGGCGLSLIAGALLLALLALLVPTLPSWTSVAVVGSMITVTGISRSPIQKLVLDRPQVGWVILIVLGAAALAALVALAATEGLGAALGVAAFIAFSVYVAKSFIGKSNQAEYLRRSNPGAAKLYENTAAAIQAGRLTPIGIGPDSKTAPADLAVTFPALEGSALWYHVRYVTPDDGEFLVACADDYAITSVRWLHREGSTGAMIEVRFADLAAYSVDMKTGTLHFSKNDGGDTSCKLAAGQDFVTEEAAASVLRVIRGERVSQ